MSVPIALIDESRLFREGLRRISEDWPFQIDIEASSLDDLGCVSMRERALACPPELVLIDTPQEGPELQEELARVRKQFPDARLIILTDHMKLDRIANAMAAGVDGYLLKDVSGAALLQSLRLVMQGEKVFPTGLADMLVNRRIAVGAGYTSIPHLAEDLTLSNTEREILQCLANGYSNKKIALVFDLSESKVKGYLKALLRRIGVENRTQAAIWALNHGVGVDVADLKGQPEPTSKDDHSPGNGKQDGGAEDPDAI